MAIIYKITNLVNNKIYIGETTRTLSARWHQHISRANDHIYNEYLYRAMRKYGVENFKIEEIVQCSNEERFKLETDYIIKYHSYVGFDNSNGYNLILSQDGINPILSQEILKYWFDGLTIVQISEKLHLNIKTIRYSLKSNGITQEDIFLRRNAYIGKNSSKTVIQYTLNGEYVAEFPSVSAAARTLGKTPSQISKACVGKYALTAYGYIWQYKYDNDVEEIVEELSHHNKVGKNQKRIRQLDLNGNTIKEYESASAAGRAFGKTHSAFATAAREGRVAYGYRWEYVI